ncbi:hypothetical protein MKW98_007451 [Papaver atlanticum]|uniref:Protein kinase domain-containing protein n=1 Tax=Papaver atlanticum TaxID=357466 RepID=A0AAD4XCW0_9MAGN|nr:hypothetical protein MKW98_007451 [Papaver atlanticum]
MFKFLKGVVGGSGTGLKDVPYNIGEPYSSAWGSWTHSRGTSKDDGSLVSIFSLTGSNVQGDGHLAAGRNGVKRLRTVRHPNILSFLHSTEAEIFDGATPKHTIYIVTEPVMPLSEKIKELGLEGTQRDEYSAWGLRQICKAVSFLNNDCKLVHGNVCLASVVVTPMLDWKLHAFDVLSEFDGNNEGSTGPMLQYEWLVGAQYKPMELANSDWAAIRKSPPYAIDSWGLGCLIYELFSGMRLAKTEELGNTASIPKSLLPDYQKLLRSMPPCRLNTLTLIENSEYFQNRLVETIQFMEILSLKDSVEKDTFIRKLPNLAEQLPRPIVLKKLASALEFGSAAAPALTALLKMASWLSPEDFTAKVYPHVSTGFSDTSAFLRELTLKSMLIWAPKLSQRTIAGSLLKYLSKLQVDEEAVIRTNTTFLLGKIASYLNDGTRKRVLINAFTVRALRDTFSPARGAGVMALCATSSYYDMTEWRLQLISCQTSSDVRSKAFEAVDLFLQIVKQLDEKINSGDTTGASGNAGLLGWAMSSLTIKGKADQAPVASAESSSQVSTAASSSVVDPPHGMPAYPTFTTDPADTRIPPSPTSDGWGEIENGIFEEQGNDEKDKRDDVEPLEEPKPAAFANIQAAKKRPIVQPKLQVTDVKLKSPVRVVKDEDEDLWGSIATPAPRSTASTSSNMQPLPLLNQLPAPSHCPLEEVVEPNLLPQVEFRTPVRHNS